MAFISLPRNDDRNIMATGANGIMEIDDRARNGSDRRIALLIDADNVPHSKIADMLAELSKYGTANIRRAYGDWASAGLKNWKDKLHDFAIRPIQQFSYSTGKNATDIALVIDAMELLYTQELDAFCLASSDADFTPLVMQLKANGHEVVGLRLVMVSVPKLPSIACPTPVTSIPLIRIVPSPSGAEIAIEPLVAAPPLSGADPPGSPASATVRPSSEPLGTRTRTPLSAMLIVSVAVVLSPSPSVRR